ncbi:MAG: AsmA family protein [Magnetococcales bacterium]|nr:AsmA family protein [Magnetococcales bacterium]
MNRLATGIVIGLTLTALLTVIIFIGFPALLDSNVIKGKIAQIIREKTGRPLVIDGALTFSFFPDVKIHIGPAHLDNPEGSDPASMATFHSATLVVRGLGLLFGRLDLVELYVDNLEITLEQSADGVADSPDPGTLSGVASWHQLEEWMVKGVSSEEDRRTLRIALSGLAAVSIGKVQLQNARIHWRDRKKMVDYSLDNVFVVSHSLGGGAMGIELSGNWNWLPVDTHGRVMLNYEVRDQGNHFEMADIHLLLTSQSDKVSLREAELRLATNLTLDFDDHMIVASDMEMGVTGWFTQYSLRDLEMILKGTAQWDIAKAVGTLADNRLTVKVHADDLPPAGMHFFMRSGLEWQAQTGAVTLNGIHLEGPADTRIQGNLVLQGLQEGLRQVVAKGHLVTEPFDPKALLVAMGLQLPRILGNEVLAKSVLVGDFQADVHGVTIDPLQIDLDSTHVDGNFSWRRSDRSEIKFDVALDQLEIDRYWDLVAISDGLPENKPLVAMLIPEISLAGLFGRLPEHLDLQGTLNARQMQISGAALDAVKLGVEMGDGVLNLDPFQFTLYQGDWKQKIQIQQRGDDSRLMVEKEMKGIQIQPFFNTIAGVAWLSGTMDLSGQVETSGNDYVSARKNLKGSYWLGMKNGAFQGIDLTQSIRNMALAIEGRPVQAATGDPVTAFSELTATARVGQGRLINSDLLAVSPSSVIKGKGEADLVGMTVDYTFSADAQAALKGMDIAYWDQLEGVVLPIHVVGPLNMLKKPHVGEPQLTRRFIAARQNKEKGGGFLQGPKSYSEAPPFIPMADAVQRNRRPMSRWKHGLFPWDQR